MGFTKRKRMVGDKFAFLQRIKPPQNSRRAQAKKAVANRNVIQLKDQEDDDEEEPDIGDIPRTISTSLDDRLLLPLLLPNAQSFESLGSPCDMMRKSIVSLASIDKNETVAVKLQSLCEQRNPPGQVSPCEESMKKQQTTETRRVVKKQTGETIARLRKITQQTPSLDHLSQYVLALSSSAQPNPSGSLPSQALRCLFSLSEHSSHKKQRIAMVKTISADGSSLVPALLSFLKRCPKKSPNKHLALQVLNNLSIPLKNKKCIALEYNGSKKLGQLLSKDPDCQMLVIIIVNLTFGDERYPLVDPEDPITRRMVARVVSFLDLWRAKGLPMDFTPLYGVNTGLCTM